MTDEPPGDPADPPPLQVALDELTDRRVRIRAAALGITAGELLRRWVVQRLEVEEAAERARGGGSEQLLRLVRAIEDVELPER